MRITLNYPSYLEQFISRNSLPTGYWEQYRLLMADGFGWADFLELNFGEMGWKVWEPVTNFEENQKQWLFEKGLTLENEDDWFLEIVRFQVRDFKPAVLFVDSYTAFQPDFLDRLRKEVPSIRLIIGWCGAPYPDGSVFKAFDVTLSNLPNLVEHLKAEGLDARLLRHGFEMSILDRLPKIPEFNDRLVEVSFTGSVVFGKEFHEERLLLLYGMVKQGIPIEILAMLSGSEKTKSVIRRLLANRGRGYRQVWREWPLRSKMQQLEKRVKPPVFGLDMYQLLADSKISLNNQIGVSKNHATNTRMYQVTGCGSCLLTDWKPDLKDKFELDHEVVAYKTPAEAVEKARYLLDHPKEAERIARAGQIRTSKTHSFRNRCEELLEIIEEKLAR